MIRGVRFLVLLALWVGGMQGCAGPGFEAALEEKYDEKVYAWQEANPDAVLTEDVSRDLMEQAKAEVKEELSREYGVQTVGAISSIATGNWPAAVFHVLGLGGLFFGLRGRKKEGVVKT